MAEMSQTSHSGHFSRIPFEMACHREKFNIGVSPIGLQVNIDVESQEKCLWPKEKKFNPWVAFLAHLTLIS